ncbi:MAG: hypothetical protein HKO65_08530 [Gemmatimonadetes bacterium]|nr:hypothetical protein [Gemmatimonadota bacterium]
MTEPTSVAQIEQEVLAASRALVAFEKAKEFDQVAAVYAREAVLQTYSGIVR